MLTPMNAPFDKRSADAAMQRVYNAVGTLISNLGLFELHIFRCISHLQLDPVISEFAGDTQFDGRVKLTKRLLVARKVSEKLQGDFTAMIAEMKPIMDNRAIVAHNAAVFAHDTKTGELHGAVYNAKAWVNGNPDNTRPVEEIEKDRDATAKLAARMGAFSDEIARTYPAAPSSRTIFQKP